DRRVEAAEAGELEPIRDEVEPALLEEDEEVRRFVARDRDVEIAVAVEVGDLHRRRRSESGIEEAPRIEETALALLEEGEQAFARDHDVEKPVRIEIHHVDDLGLIRARERELRRVGAERTAHDRRPRGEMDLAAVASDRVLERYGHRGPARARRESGGGVERNRAKADLAPAGEIVGRLPDQVMDEATRSRGDL